MMCVSWELGVGVGVWEFGSLVDAGGVKCI